MAEQDVSSVRDSLSNERDHLRARISELISDNDDGMAFDENFADSGQVAAEQGENKVLASSLREQLDDIEEALAKLDAGTYGRCEVCGEAIGEARLEAMPATRFCIKHA